MSQKKWCSKSTGNDAVRRFERARSTSVLLPHKIIPKFLTRRCFKSTKQSRNQKISGSRKIKAEIMRVREEMEEISKEQVCIRDGQRQVRRKLDEIQRERDQSRKETEIISKQSESIQLRINLMLKISKARAQNDSALADQHIRSLRDTIAE